MNLTSTMVRLGTFVLVWLCSQTVLAHPTGSEILHRSGPSRNRIDLAITFYGYGTDAPAGYGYCAGEGGRCSFTGTKSVAYGANGAFAYQTATDGIDCNSGAFGGDPAPNIGKACYVEGGEKNHDSERAAATTYSDYMLETAVEWRRYKNFLNVIAAYRDSAVEPVAPDWDNEMRADARVGAPGYDLVAVLSRTHSTPAGECFDYPKGIMEYGGNNSGGYMLHVLGHCVHRLGDIYPNATAWDGWPNSTTDASGNHWSWWLGYTEPFGHNSQGHTGVKADEVVAAYPIPWDDGTTGHGYRPTNNSYMSCCPMDDFGNPIERERVILNMYQRWIDPLDSWMEEGEVWKDPSSLWVDAVDPEVIKVDWYVDGALVAADGGEVFYPGDFGLAAGTHEIEARAYDEIVTHAFSDRGGSEAGTPGSQASHPLDWVRRELDTLRQNILWNVDFTTAPVPTTDTPAPRLDDMTLVIGAAQVGEQVAQLEVLHPTAELFRFSAKGDTNFFEVDETTGAIRVTDASYADKPDQAFALCVTTYQEDTPSNAVTNLVTIAVAPPSVLIADSFDDGNPQTNDRGRGKGFNRMWNDGGSWDNPTLEGGEAKGSVWMRSGGATRLLSYDTFAVNGSGPHRLTVELGPCELKGGAFSILVTTEAPQNGGGEFPTYPSFGVYDLASFKVRADDATLLEVAGPEGLDLSQGHTITIEWTESGFVYLVDGVQAAQGNWPDGFMARWNDIPANVLIESTAAAMPIERVLLEDEPEGSTGWVPPTGDNSACASADTDDDTSKDSTGAGCACEVGAGASDDASSSLFVLLLRSLLS